MPSTVRRMQNLLRGQVPPPSSSKPPTLKSEERKAYVPDRPLALFVPGYLYPRPIMRPLAKRFHKAGFECDLLRDVVHERRVYDQQLVEITKHLERHKQELKAVPSVTFIGHAVGGLHAYGAAVWLAHTDWYKGKIVALPLGAPFRKRGNYLQDVFLRMSLVRHGATALLQPTGERLFTPDPKVRLLCVAGTRDELVDVDRAKMHKTRAALVVDANHQELVLSKEVAGVLIHSVRSLLNDENASTQSY